MQLATAQDQTIFQESDLAPVVQSPLLPDHLRTGHWYCDIHHGMFLILLTRGAHAASHENEKLTHYFVDTITIYWLVHCLMEEEDMAGALMKGIADPSVVRQHCRAHTALTQWWDNKVFSPLKTSAASCGSIARTMTEFLEQVVHHINEMDQSTYGKASPSTEESLIQAMEALSRTHLPLSPQMAGCQQVAECLAPRMSTFVRPDSLSPLAMEQVKSFFLAPRREPLLDEEHGGFRDLFFAHYGAGRRNNSNTEMPVARF
ncbi:hypothetical protein HEQ60_00675 [Haematospirillum sp. H1815]|uniref:hypothetical protein n=1 Tax=Haematospirillum sp. H1815 TaxID=2723108 RepID=UPI00143871D2|nr:hypothetical protein [Haematospirillum sp. H1815]NKD76290.1 hypothetical protein [Haematospirillum sp. H1815]